MKYSFRPISVNIPKLLRNCELAHYIKFYHLYLCVSSMSMDKPDNINIQKTKSNVIAKQRQISSPSTHHFLSACISHSKAYILFYLLKCHLLIKFTISVCIVRERKSEREIERYTTECQINSIKCYIAIENGNTLMFCGRNINAIVIENAIEIDLFEVFFDESLKVFSQSNGQIDNIYKTNRAIL